MKSGFVINFEEVIEAQNDFGLFERSLNDAIVRMNTLIDSVASLGGLQGEMADSVKGYLSEVHKGLLDKMLVLVESMATDYAQEFYRRFGESPISDASFSSCWPYKVMLSAEDSIWKALGAGKLQAVEGLVEDGLATAKQAGFSCKQPDASSLRSLGRKENYETQSVRDAVGWIDDWAARFFEDAKGDSCALSSALAAVVAKYGKKSITTSYQAGSFYSYAESSGLNAATMSAESRIRELADSTFSVQEDSFNKALDGYANYIDEGLTEKRAWEWVKLVGIVLSACGALVTVGTGGAAIPVFLALLSFGSGAGDAVDTLDSIEQIDQLLAGEIEIGDIDVALSTDSSGREVLKIGKTTLGYAKDYPELVAAYKNGDQAKFEQMILSSLGGEIEDQLLKQMGKEGSAAYKQWKTYVEDGVGLTDEAMKGDLKASSTLGSLGSGISVTANAQIESLDADLQKYQGEIDALVDGLGDKFGRSADTVRYSTLGYDGAVCEVSIGSNSRQPDARQEASVVEHYTAGAGRGGLSGNPGSSIPSSPAS